MLMMYFFGKSHISFYQASQDTYNYLASPNPHLSLRRFKHFIDCTSYFRCTPMPVVQLWVSQSRAKMSTGLSLSFSLRSQQVPSLGLCPAPDPGLVIPCCLVGYQVPSKVTVFLYFTQLFIPQQDCSKAPTNKAISGNISHAKKYFRSCISYIQENLPENF